MFRLRRALSLLLIGTVLPMAVAYSQGSAASFKPPEDIQFRTRDIISEGTRMSAEVFSLKTAEGKKLPTIILCHGWGGVAKDLRPEAIEFARAGYLVVTFDYRGLGSSDARLVLAAPTPASRSGSRFMAEVKEVREVVDPLDQTTDPMNAIHWLAGEPQSDISRIGL
jgi:dienelactone hydrolase